MIQITLTDKQFSTIKSEVVSGLIDNLEEIVKEAIYEQVDVEDKVYEIVGQLANDAVENKVIDNFQEIKSLIDVKYLNDVVAEAVKNKILRGF